jgi:hypothetical protein
MSGRYSHRNIQGKHFTYSTNRGIHPTACSLGVEKPPPPKNIRTVEAEKYEHMSTKSSFKNDIDDRDWNPQSDRQEN